jgi:hypothetical protein
MSKKISNSLLEEILRLGNQDLSLSLNDCSDHVGVKGTTLSTWHRNLKSGKWSSGYEKTEDGEPLIEDLVEKFKKSFAFSGSASKILRRLVTKKCLNNRSCFAKQHKILKRLFKKYPSVSFWLHVDFGDPRDDILLFIGKAEFQLKKKYLDFHAVDEYTPFTYDYTKEDKPKKDKPPKTIWDFYKK